MDEVDEVSVTTGSHDNAEEWMNRSSFFKLEKLPLSFRIFISSSLVFEPFI